MPVDQRFKSVRTLRRVFTYGRSWWSRTPQARGSADVSSLQFSSCGMRCVSVSDSRHSAARRIVTVKGNFPVLCRINGELTMSQESDYYERRQRAMAFLRGKVLRRTDSHVGGGVSGVISSSQTKYALFLYEDDTFSYEVTEFRSVSSGGYSIPSEEKSAMTGYWEIDILENEPFLVLIQDGSIVQRWRNGIGDEEGIHLLDGQRWNRYLIRK